MNDLPWDQRLARMLVRPLARIGASPNQVTTLGLMAGLAAGWLFARGGQSVHWGAMLFMCAAFMDHMDGELARLTGKTSRFGHYYDHFAAFTSYVVLFLGMGVGLRTSRLGELAPLLGGLTGLAVAGSFGFRIWIEERFGKGMVQQDNFAGFQAEDGLYIVGPATWCGGVLPLLLAAAVGAPLFLLFVMWAAWRGRSATARRRA